MIKPLSVLIYWGCNLMLLLVPTIILYFLWDINSFAALMQAEFEPPVQWHTVAPGQWYAMLSLATTYAFIGLAGLFFLRSPFKNFAQGELFTLSNSINLKRFASCLFVQALASPLFYIASSVLMSLNHPEGQQLIFIEIGSDEIKSVAVAMILWVMSQLLVEAARLQSENREFV